MTEPTTSATDRTTETTFAPSLLDEVLARTPAVTVPVAVNPARRELYFADRPAASDAALKLRGQGYAVSFEVLFAFRGKANVIRVTAILQPNTPKPVPAPVPVAPPAPEPVSTPARRTAGAAVGLPVTARQWSYIRHLRLQCKRNGRADLADKQISNNRREASRLIAEMQAALRRANVAALTDRGGNGGGRICCCGVEGCNIGPFVIRR